MEKYYTKDQIIEDLINYTVGLPTFVLEEIGDAALNQLGDFGLDWQSAPCDAEGATKEQAAELDKILDKYGALIEAIQHK